MGGLDALPEILLPSFTGAVVNITQPEPWQITIEDIAHALAMTCRWAGHCTQFLSVAQHSVMVSGCVPQTSDLPLRGLLHDAAEAWLGDIPSPIRAVHPMHDVLECNLLNVIGERFGVRGLGVMPPEVRAADLVVRATEARDFIAGDVRWSEPPPPPLPERIAAWPPHLARIYFLRLFEQLTEGRHDAKGAMHVSGMLDAGQARSEAL